MKGSEKIHGVCADPDNLVSTLVDIQKVRLSLRKKRSPNTNKGAAPKKNTSTY